MSTDLPELPRFFDFLEQKLTNGGSQLSPEDALDEWRAANPTSEEFEASVADLREALAEADRGDGLPIDAVLDELKRKYNLPSVSSNE